MRLTGLPNYRIVPIDETDNYIAETNEHRREEEQAEHASLIAAAPEMLSALEYFFNIMHDYSSSRRKGYVKHAMDIARSAILKATVRKFA
jgi:hypothetical protein